METLPFDITEKILCSITSPLDLRSLASTAHSWAELIIPRHIQYRILRLGPGNHYSLWAHLAERKDLAQNIRDVRLTGVSRKWERHPTTLVASLEDQLEVEQESAFLQAFQNLEKLEGFTWRPHKCPDFMDPYQNPRFLEILNQARRLSSLDVSRWANQTDGTLQKWQPLFNFGELKRLHLHGSFWASFTLGSALTSLLLRCPDIQDLLLYYDQVSPCFVKCYFPQLRILSLYGTHGTGQSDGDILKFIKAHDTIEDLAWYPLSERSLLPGSLPALKKISSTHQFIMNILEDKSIPNRALRSIAKISINPGSMKVLEGIEGTQVQELYLSRYDQIQEIHRLAELFPTITTLEIPPQWEHNRTLDDLMLTFSQFPALECILNTQIWALILYLKGSKARHDAIMRLAHACPNLRLITFFDSQRRKITLFRNDGRVTWEDAVDDGEEY